MRLVVVTSSYTADLKVMGGRGGGEVGKGNYRLGIYFVLKYIPVLKVLVILSNILKET